MCQAQLLLCTTNRLSGQPEAAARTSARGNLQHGMRFERVYDSAWDRGTREYVQNHHVASTPVAGHPSSSMQGPAAKDSPPKVRRTQKLATQRNPTYP